MTTREILTQLINWQNKDTPLSERLDWAEGEIQGVVAETEPEVTVEELAEFMHDTYEGIAQMSGWGTQKKCQVKFEDLPEANKKTMLGVAEAVHNLLKRKDGE